MNIEPAPKTPTKVTQDETLPPSGAPVIAEDRKPIKKRRVLLTESKESTPQPIELVRQVATFWETTDSATGVSTYKPGPYSYEDFFSAVKAEETTHNPNVSDFKSLDDSSHGKPPAYTPAIPIVELMQPTSRLDEEEEEEDIEEELNCLTLSQGIQTIPRQRQCHLNSITPSPTLMGAPAPVACLKKNSSLARVGEPSDFDPIPWTESEPCAGLIESTIDFLLSMDLDGAESSKRGKYGDDKKNFMSGTPLNSPAGKRVRFNPDANMTIPITPRKKLAVPVQRKLSPKSRIERVMVENPFFSPVKTIQLGQSSSAFSPKESQHYFR
ncbi:hypothetical protein FisN_33Lh007 [Fistulifera solaris]|uniref:Uncharacterized protein n=1 Tax=Fistulifera solaris TaxID=1519565 RepID=A0A1Z5KA34_FISSO|nr:hypothetical protein FisN_33Lh007 [Fistulifera solaris]|eukprot:GAX23119.1 hypothetical protein FisN_33Lh007 [Fistulifera solaris]